MILISIVSTISIILSIHLLIGYKLPGVGMGWLLGQIIVTILDLYIIKYLLFKKTYES